VSCARSVEECLWYGASRFADNRQAIEQL